MKNDNKQTTKIHAGQQHKEKNQPVSEKIKNSPTNKEQRDSTATGIIKNEKGRIGYIVAWLLGVPASVLFVIFLIRGK